MPFVTPNAVFTFNGLTPGLYTRRIFPASLCGREDLILFHVMYLRTWGSSLPAITAMSAEMGIMSDPNVDAVNGYHRFPIAPFASGSSLNIGPNDFSILPREDLYAYLRLNGTAAPAALYLAHLSFIFETRRLDETPTRHILPKGPIRTSHLDP